MTGTIYSTWSAKDPADVLSVGIDFSAVLPIGGTLASLVGALTATPGDLTFSAVGVSGGMVTATASGGTPQTYQVSCTVVTSGGEVMRVTLPWPVAVRTA
jgi:hypothetical protein